MLAVACLGCFAGSAPAHYTMLLPRAAVWKKGEAITFTCQWGHPFEHQLFDAPLPQSVTVLAPDGKKTELTGTLKKTTVPAGKGKKVTAYQFRYTPPTRGDYLFLLRTPPIWMEEDREFLQDVVKVVLHVQAQKGWDTPAGAELEFVPLTRPYGLEAGMVFQAELRTVLPAVVLPRRGKPEMVPPAAVSRGVRGALVEVERYNATPPVELPPEEQITRTARTGPSGVVTTTLTDPGWWCLCAAVGGTTKKHEGKPYRVRFRSILWVFVAEKAKRR